MITSHVLGHVNCHVTGHVTCHVICRAVKSVDDHIWKNGSKYVPVSGKSCYYCFSNARLSQKCAIMLDENQKFNYFVRKLFKFSNLLSKLF